MNSGAVNTIKTIKKVCDSITLIFVLGMLTGLVLYFCGVTGLLYGFACSLLLLSMIAILIDLTPLLKKVAHTRNQMIQQNQPEDLNYLKKTNHIKYYSIIAIVGFVGLIIAVYLKQSYLIGILSALLITSFLLTILYLLLNYLAEILENEIKRAK